MCSWWWIGRTGGNTHKRIVSSYIFLFLRGKQAKNFTSHREYQECPLQTRTCYLYCCTVHLVDSLNITLPTNALIVRHLFENRFFKSLFLNSEKCFKKSYFKINDIELVHLLVVWYLVNELANSLQQNKDCLFQESYGTQKYTVRVKYAVWGAFAKLRKATNTFVMSVRLGQFGSH